MEKSPFIWSVEWTSNDGIHLCIVKNNNNTEGIESMIVQVALYMCVVQSSKGPISTSKSTFNILFLITNFVHAST